MKHEIPVFVKRFPIKCARTSTCQEFLLDKCADWGYNAVLDGGIPLEKRVELTWLLDFYGPLLTEHRQSLIRLYCDEDLTLAEIAEQTGITRQGVFDAIRNAESQLRGYEEKLGLLKRHKELTRAVGDCRARLQTIQAAPGSEKTLLDIDEALLQIERQ